MNNDNHYMNEAEQSFCPMTGAVKVHGIYVPQGVIETLKLHGVQHPGMLPGNVLNDLGHDLFMDQDFDQEIFTDPGSVGRPAHQSTNWTEQVRQKREAQTKSVEQYTTVA